MMVGVLIDARDRFAQRQVEWTLEEFGVSPADAGIVCEGCGQEICPPGTGCPLADMGAD